MFSFGSHNLELENNIMEYKIQTHFTSKTLFWTKKYEILFLCFKLHNLEDVFCIVDCKIHNTFQFVYLESEICILNGIIGNINFIFQNM